MTYEVHFQLHGNKYGHESSMLEVKAHHVNTEGNWVYFYDLQNHVVAQFSGHTILGYTQKDPALVAWESTVGQR